jgi:hypothetical protein
MIFSFETLPGDGRCGRLQNPLYEKVKKRLCLIRETTETTVTLTRKTADKPMRMRIFT